MSALELWIYCYLYFCDEYSDIQVQDYSIIPL